MKTCKPAVQFILLVLTLSTQYPSLHAEPSHNNTGWVDQATGALISNADEIAHALGNATHAQQSLWGPFAMHGNQWVPWISVGVSSLEVIGQYNQFAEISPALAIMAAIGSTAAETASNVLPLVLGVSLSLAYSQTLNGLHSQMTDFGPQGSLSTALSLYQLWLDSHPHATPEEQADALNHIRGNVSPQNVVDSSPTVGLMPPSTLPRPNRSSGGRAGTLQRFR